MKAVAYTSNFMYNTVNQPSTREQLSAIEQYAQENSIEILKVYTDFFRDRIHDQKTGLLAMMDDVDTQKFDAVLVYDEACVIRDSHELLYMKQELSDNNVAFIPIKNKVLLNSEKQRQESAIIESLLEGMAEYYSRNLEIKIMQKLM